MATRITSSSSLRVLHGGLRPRPPMAPIEAELVCDVRNTQGDGVARPAKIKATIDAGDRVCYTALREAEGDVLRVCGCQPARAMHGSLMRQVLQFLLG